jgi:GAF domain-containing protein
MAVPLESRGTLLGALSFVTAASGHRYTKDDLELAEELGRRTSLAIENARLYQHAKEALHAREELLAIAAHEIRTPLTSLHLGVQSLRLGLVRPAFFKNLLDRIEE